MGIVDSTWTKLTCEKCGATETRTARQRGSSFGMGHWGSFAEFNAFDAKIETISDGPEVTSASCKKCKTPAKIESEIGTAPPA